jgi:hypothetical protein
MSATQFEINYENALQAKDEAQQAYTDANNAYLANQQYLTNAKVENDKYADCVIESINFIHLKTKTDCATIKAAVPSGKASALYTMVWKNFPDTINGLNARSNYATAVAKDAGLKATADDARAKYQEASIVAQNAYDDWMNWKVSNMTPEELDEYAEVGQQAELFGLKMAVWKWVAIGVGLLLFIFAAWWILRKFK